MFAAALVAGKKAGDRRPAAIIRAGFAPGQPRDRDHHPVRPARGQRLVPRDPARHHRLRPRPAGVPAEQLHARARRGGAGQRGRRRELGRRVLRALLRPRHGRRDHARRPVGQLHPHDREQRRHPAGPAAADRRRPRGRRRGHEQHPARRADHRPAAQRSRPRSWPSTTTPATSRCRSPCWCRSSPACSGSPTPSGCCACPEIKPSAAAEARPALG